MYIRLPILVRFHLVASEISARGAEAYDRRKISIELQEYDYILLPEPIGRVYQDCSLD